MQFIDDESTSKIDVVISHAHISGAVNSSEIEIEAGEAIHFNPSKFYKYKLGVFGHIHKYQVLGKNIYCGGIATNTFDEADYIKGFMHVIDPKNYMFIPFETPETQYATVVIDLINKDTVKYADATLKKIANNKLLKLVIYARDIMQVNQVELKKMFETYGIVMRLEIVIAEKYDSDATEEDLETVFEKLDYKAVFKNWINEKSLPLDDKKLVLSLGYDIIAEVINAERN